MNSSFITSQITLSRKSFLHKQISEAFNSDQVEKLSVLKSHWVHRYGLKTLPKEEELKESFFEAEDLNISLRNHEAEEKINRLSENYKETESNYQKSLEQQKTFDAINFDELASERIFDDCKNEKSIFIDEFKGEEKDCSDKSSDSVLIPPPTPILNNLRKWLPNK